MKAIVFHNNKCSKSTAALAFLEEHQIPFELRNYITEPLSKKELKELLKKLNLKAKDIIRTKEPLYKELFEQEKTTKEAEMQQAILTHPILLERPIVVFGNKAMIARPTERLEEMIP